jgi:hypothetical protein
MAKKVDMEGAIKTWLHGGILEANSEIIVALGAFCDPDILRAYLQGEEAGSKAVRQAMQQSTNAAFGWDPASTDMGNDGNWSHDKVSSYKKAFNLGFRAKAGIVIYPGPDFEETNGADSGGTLKKAMELAKKSEDPDLANRHQSVFEKAPTLDSQFGVWLEAEAKRMHQDAISSQAKAEAALAKVEARSAKTAAKAKESSKAAAATVSAATAQVQAWRADALLSSWKKLKPAYEKAKSTSARGTLWGSSKRKQTVNASSRKDWRPTCQEEEYDGWEDAAKKWMKNFDSRGSRGIREAKEQCAGASNRLASHGCFCHEMVLIP